MIGLKELRHLLNQSGIQTHVRMRAASPGFDWFTVVYVCCDWSL